MADEAWLRLGHTTGKPNQYVHNRMAEKEKNEGVAMAQSKSGPQPDYGLD